MATEYTVWLSTPAGEHVAVLDNFLSLTYKRRVNDTGYSKALFGVVSFPLTLVVPYADWLPLLLQRDYRLEVWRSIGDGLLALDTETVWFISRVTRRVTSEGRRVIQVEAEPAIALLARRIVAYAANSDETVKSGPADDVMKEIVEENFGSSAVSGRDVSAWLSVEPDFSLGAAVVRSFPRRIVLNVLKDLASASAEVGTPVYFDLVAPTPGGALQFRTYSPVRGTDHSFGNSMGAAVVLLSLETGTLTSVMRGTDWHDEATHVYVAGQGAEEARQVVAVGDDDRAGLVPFGRREVLQDARHILTEASLEDEGERVLRQRQPESLFEVAIASRNPWAMYGLHWGFGDRVSVEADGEVVTCLVDEVSVTVDRAGERVGARLRVDTAQMEGYGAGRQLEDVRAMESEHVHQQVQQEGVRTGELVYVPGASQVTVYGGAYSVEGTLQVADGSTVRVLEG
jgi:hypothetical protein